MEGIGKHVWAGMPRQSCAMRTTLSGGRGGSWRTSGLATTVPASGLREVHAHQPYRLDGDL